MQTAQPDDRQPFGHSRKIQPQSSKPRPNLFDSLTLCSLMIQISLPISQLKKLASRVHAPTRGSSPLPLSRIHTWEIKYCTFKSTFINVLHYTSHQGITNSSLDTVLGGYSDTLWNLNFSRTVAGITKWFWVTIEGYLSYLLPKFEDLVPTSLGSGAI